jgi:hypothetical protein
MRYPADAAPLGRCGLSGDKRENQMYRISQENNAMLQKLRKSPKAYNAFRDGCGTSPLGSEVRKFPISPTAAMNMPNDASASDLPITVTITLTTILWPRTAH